MEKTFGANLKRNGVVAAALTLALGAGCVGMTGCAANNSGSSSDGPIEVKITDTSCEVASNEVPSGTVTFSITNSGTATNEFEILAEDQLQIISERENLTPGTTVELTVQLEPGSYYTASKTNMVGALVGTTALTVTDSGEAVEVSDDEKELREKAVTNYTAYIKDQAGQLIDATNEFLEAWDEGKGDLEKAKELYPTARMYYERIEPTAESFGDIDPNLDLREKDAQAGDLDDMSKWKGWHAIEKDLWSKSGFSDKKRAKLAKELKADTQSLYDLVYSKDFEVSLSDVSNGAIDLMEEVATSKISGEEEAFSHTDLYDFWANVEGAKVAYGNVKDLAKLKDADMVTKLDSAFDDVQTELEKYKSGDTYKSYDELSDSEIKALSDKVDALRGDLADLTATILK